jgi:hypothetical protein
MPDGVMSIKERRMKSSIAMSNSHQRQQSVKYHQKRIPYKNHGQLQTQETSVLLVKNVVTYTLMRLGFMPLDLVESVLNRLVVGSGIRMVAENQLSVVPHFTPTMLKAIQSFRSGDNRIE